jgi:hypothetical protein
MPDRRALEIEDVTVGSRWRLRFLVGVVLRRGAEIVDVSRLRIAVDGVDVSEYVRDVGTDVTVEGLEFGEEWAGGCGVDLGPLGLMAFDSFAVIAEPLT